jgi:hypothetical protein
VRWVALAAIAVGGPAWIALRDWAPAPAADREQARVLTAGRQACPGCRVELLRRAPAGGWVVRVSGRRASSCLLVDPEEAAVRPEHGLTGAARVACPRP